MIHLLLGQDERELIWREWYMAEQFLTLMADFDEESQALMKEWHNQLKQKGFVGTQTPGLPFHISLATFSLDKEQAVICEMQRLASAFAAIPVHMSHIGIFAGGKVLFAAPDMNPPKLFSLREAIHIKTDETFPWTPHATILIDETETICNALPVLLKSFHPFMGMITKLHLCAFWPTREILSVDLCEV